MNLNGTIGISSDYSKSLILSSIKNKNNTNENGFALHNIYWSHCEQPKYWMRVMLAIPGPWLPIKADLVMGL